MTLSMTTTLRRSGLRPAASRAAVPRLGHRLSQESASYRLDSSAEPQGQPTQNHLPLNRGPVTFSPRQQREGQGDPVPSISTLGSKATITLPLGKHGGLSAPLPRPPAMGRCARVRLRRPCSGGQRRLSRAEVRSAPFNKAQWDRRPPDGAVSTGKGTLYPTKQATYSRAGGRPAVREPAFPRPTPRSRGIDTRPLTITLAGLAAPAARLREPACDRGPQGCFGLLRQAARRGEGSRQPRPARGRCDGGKFYVFYDGKKFYPVEKTAGDLYVASLITIKGGDAKAIAKAEAVLLGQSNNHLKKLQALIEYGHELVQARQKRCNELKNGSGASGSSGATAGSVTFTLVPGETQVSNPSSQYTKVPQTTASGMAYIECPCTTGAVYRIDYSWTVPDKLMSGHDFPVTMELTVSKSASPISSGMTVAGPGVKQQLLVTYPNPSTLTKDYTFPLAESRSTSGDHDHDRPRGLGRGSHLPLQERLSKPPGRDGRQALASFSGRDAAGDRARAFRPFRSVPARSRLSGFRCRS